MDPRRDMTKDICTTPSQGPTAAPAFAELISETRCELERLGRVRRYRTGQSVIEESTAPDIVGTVRSGILRMQKTLSDGRQHVVGLLVEGDMFGRVFDDGIEFSIEAATDAEICAFPRAPFEALLLRSPDLDRAVLLNVLNELDRARDWMIILSNQKIASRLAGFLILMCSRFAAVDHLVEPREDGIEVKIPISRTDLAHLLGTRPESLSRAFHALADEAVIVLLEPDRVLLRDLRALAERAGEDEVAAMPQLRDLIGAMRPTR
jgi:CRP/FNR family transcriptional regulator